MVGRGICFGKAFLKHRVFSAIPSFIDFRPTDAPPANDHTLYNTVNIIAVHHTSINPANWRLS